MQHSSMFAFSSQQQNALAGPDKQGIAAKRRNVNKEVTNVTKSNRFDL